MKKTGLTLAGGGARAAYQVGVLRGIYEITRSKEVPFQIISGISAGAINGVWLATGCDDFDKTTQTMWNTWSNLKINDVFKTDLMSLIGIGSKWLRDLSLGAWLGSSKVTHLLDTSPLFELLSTKMESARIQEHIESKRLHAVALSTTQYHSGKSYTFFDGCSEIKPWVNGNRLGVRRTIEIKHVMASSALPVFFPPVKLEEGFFGDGGMNFRTPLSPTIHLGAEKILAIGIHYSNADVAPALPDPNETLSLGDIAGALLNSMFLDSLDSDVRRLERINRTLSVFSEEQLLGEVDHLRKIPILSIRPSKDLGTLATGEFAQLPRMLRHMLKGLGSTDESGWDLLSYLAFDGVYSKALLELGYEDAFIQKEQILEFFRS